MIPAWRSWCVFGGLAAVAGAQAAAIDQATLLQRMIDLDWLWRPPMPGESCVQFSSHDRASRRGPGDPAAWYANDDRGHHLRVAARDGVQEFVMAEATGPGSIVRIWSANPRGLLHFDLDGVRVWSVDFADLCSGRIPGVPEPIAGVRSKGASCHLPIPFAQSMVLSCTAGDCYYAVDVVRWPAAQPVATFVPARLASLRVGERQTTAVHPVGPRDTEVCVPVRRQVVDKGQCVVKFHVDMPKDVATADQVEILRHTLLVVHCGDEETVRVPVADFFALGAQANPFVSRCLALTRLHAICTFPMPMPDGGSLELVADEDYGTMAPTFGRVQTVPLAPGPALCFRASYHLAKGVPTRPFSDHLVLDATGLGRFVGCSLLVRNPSRLWWGEGDEKFTVDGEAFPSWFGTGTEDYFGYAWCDPTRFASLFSVQAECQGPMNFGFTQLHRTHVLDSVPFQRSFRFDLERWHWVETIAMDYATVAYWYGAPGATSGLPPVPAAAERTLATLPPPPVLRCEGVLEAEALRVVACPSGTAAAQDVWFLEGQFSDDRQLWWREGKLGDALVLAVPVAVAGRYRVSAAFCRGPEAAIVQCRLGGQVLGTPFDGYAPQPRSSGPQELGTVTLPAGEVELRLELTGYHAAAKPGGMLGLDYVKLEKMP